MAKFGQNPSAGSEDGWRQESLKWMHADSMVDAAAIRICTKSNTVKPLLSDHIKHDIFLAFQTGGCILLNESSAESSGMSSALLSFSNKQPPVNSDFHVT